MVDGLPSSGSSRISQLRATNYQLLHINQHILAFHLDGIHGQAESRTVACLPGLRVPLPAMPGANHLVVHDDALAQGAAAVQANVVHGGNGSVHVGDAHHFFANGEFFGFARLGQIGFGGNASEGHGAVASSWLLARTWVSPPGASSYKLAATWAEGFARS